MRYYPVGLNIKDRACLVVGGGQVGTRKVKTLLACGAQVTVVTLQTTPELDLMAAEGRIIIERRSYQSTDLAEVFLVIGATDNQPLNRRIHTDAEAAHRLCNIADQPELCNFILPATVQQGDLTITVSTAGNSPAFAKYLRHKLQIQFGPEYARFLELMGAIRKRLLAADHAPEVHKPLFEQLIESGLLEAISTDDHRTIDNILTNVLGPGFTYRELIHPEQGR
jgi:precorrin-2 dehydrogenase/sirohydrochlorin ferrochelatase